MPEQNQAQCCTCGKTFEMADPPGPKTIVMCPECSQPGQARIAHICPQCNQRFNGPKEWYGEGPRLCLNCQGGQ